MDATSEDFPIRIEDLHKSYGDFRAVDGLSLSVKRNSFTGLLGPNGAGKSTTLKMLTGLIRPTSGHVYLNGFDVTRSPDRALEGVGTVVETPEYYLYMTPRETFRYIGELVGMSSESISAQTDEILAQVRMTDVEDKRLGTFSKGMRQRISIGLSLLNDPSIIILDEPTSGLDPRGMAEMRDILKNVRNGRNNLTVLMSSHMMHEVTDLCDRVAIVEHGKMIKEASMEDILADGEVRTLFVRTLSPATESDVRVVADQDNVESAEVWGDEIRVAFKGSRKEERELLLALAGSDIDVYNVTESDNALEDTYLRLVKESRR